ncbi:NAD-dependent epimerase/dehydratase family protein [Ochrovirga pacifica]|uniref:NAD-dependent epimerase/dehydratase family protein n=1 Tax=Ochrovirga pacifica TaxID=1042376 RepID=UPI0002559DC0|nr:NAD-dependent epimerase/dehydratase family protein [Ochrovirga pacifica]
MDKISVVGKKILVIGGTGYLGSFLVKELMKKQADVYVASLNAKPQKQSFKLDITNPEEVCKLVQKIKPDVVYHLAANINRERNFDLYEQMHQVNVSGVLHVLKALKKINCQFIFTSTSEVYGNNTSPFKETQIPKPVSPYSLTKYQAEKLIETFCSHYSVNYTILRLFNFYGEGMSKQFFIPQMIDSLKNNNDFLMTKGEQARDFLYVSDVVAAMILAINKRAYGEVFNVCSGKGTELKSLAIEVDKMISSTAKIVLGALPYREQEVWEMIGDSSKIANVLGFGQQIELREGINNTIKK